jgi:hypothetical protein
LALTLTLTVTFDVDRIDTSLHKILIDKSVDDAIGYVKQLTSLARLTFDRTISDLLMNRLDISELVITKANHSNKSF